MDQLVPVRLRSDSDLRTGREVIVPKRGCSVFLEQTPGKDCWHLNLIFSRDGNSKRVPFREPMPEHHPPVSSSPEVQVFSGVDDDILFRFNHFGNVYEAPHNIGGLAEFLLSHIEEPENDPEVDSEFYLEQPDLREERVH